MTYTVVLAIVVVILALSFDFINGFHDTANAIATVVSTRALSPRAAILMAATLNIVGAVTGTGVAEAIAKNIIKPEMVTMEVLIGGLIGAITWNLLTWYYGIPSSSSHALIGGVAGAALASAGTQALSVSGFTKIVLSFIISPVAGLFIGSLLMLLLQKLLVNMSSWSVTKYFSKLQLVSAAAMAFTHGSNDAQKSMGIIASALFAAKLIPALHVPFWVVLLCAGAMGAGTSAGGWRIIKTLGHKMVKLHPVHGFAAETSAAVIIEVATRLNLPVSTTHVISSTIMGVGVSKGFKAVNWGVARNIGLAMIMTIPASAAVGGLAYFVMNLFSHAAA